MIKDGKSDKEIVDFMVERYGEFILYRPRLSPATLLLWGAPVFLLVFGVILLLVIVRKRRRLDVAVDAGLSSVERERLASLLDSSPDKKTTENANKKSKQEKQ
jgi:cytochrome c-type biogenesis protein CcmH